jgi:hypothetical protein
MTQYIEMQADKKTDIAPVEQYNFEKDRWEEIVLDLKKYFLRKMEEHEDLLEQSKEEQKEQ